MHQLIKTAEEGMKKSIESFKHDIAKIRTGRAHPSLLDDIKIDYYGNETPLSQVASITVSDARTLSITPWEKKLISAIEKAIMTSDLGLNPASSSDVIRVPLPPLNEQRRKELTKLARNDAESARVGIRAVRRDSNTAIKDLVKGKHMPEDESHKLEDDVQKLTDKYIQEVDNLLNAKEAELMAV